jgi:hypothetical protein
MERNQKPVETKEEEHFHGPLAVVPDASHDASALKLGDQDEEHGTTQAEEHISTSPPASSDALAAAALETVRSARSSRSDTMYDQTPPDFDVRIDKSLGSPVSPLDISPGANWYSCDEQVTVDDSDQGFDSAVSDLSRP